MQFFAAACEWCMLHCVLFDCNGRKCTENALSIPAAACSPQLLREIQDILWRNTPSCLLFFVFSPHDTNVFVTDLTVGNVVTHMQGFSSGNFDNIFC